MTAGGSQPANTPVSRPPIRVVRVIARLNIGGPARHVGLLSSGLRDRGYHTTVVYGEPDRTEGTLEHLLDPAAGDRVKLAGLGRSVNVFGDVRAFVALVGLLFRVRPDVIHTHTAKAGTLGRLSAAIFNLMRRRRHRAVVVHTFHGHVLDGYFSALMSAIIRTIERVLARLSDAIVAISPEQRADLADRYHIAPATKVEVIRLGLDLSSLLAVDDGSPALRVAFGLADDQVVIGFVGRLVPVKNVDLLIRAFAAMAHGAPSSVLLIAGDGPLQPELVTLAGELGQADRVKFVGWQGDLPALYRTIDILALTSRNEGTPVAVIEAMAAGKPVVATRVGGVADVVADGTTGLLVAPNDVEALASALGRLAQSRQDRERFGTAGRRRVLGRYDASRLVDDVDALYRRTLDAKRGISEFAVRDVVKYRA